MFIFYNDQGDTLPTGSITELFNINNPSLGDVIIYDGANYSNSASISGSNTDLTNINASNINAGILNYARLPNLSEITLSGDAVPPYISSITAITPSGPQEIEIIGEYFSPITQLNIPGVTVNNLEVRSPNKIIASISKSGLSGNKIITLANGANTNQIWAEGIKSIDIFTDPYWANVLLFLKGNGENNNTNIVDSSLNPKQLTRFGNTKISTNQAKYGGSSIYFDGSGDYIQLPSNDFNLFAEDFTLEFWIHTSDKNNRAIVGFDIASAFYLNNKFLFWKDVRGEILSNNATDFPLNSWVHIAYVRLSGVLSLFQNGIKIAFANMAEGIDLNSKYIGQRAYSNDFIGYLDSFRITKGVGRYTTNFNPETETFLNT